MRYFLFALLLTGCTLTGPASPNDYGNWLVSDIFTGIYYITPAAIGDALPYKQDEVCFKAFGPKLTIPTDSNETDVPKGYPLAGYDNNGGFGIIDLKTDACIDMTVKGVEPLCVVPTCTWNHNTFYGAPDDPKYLSPDGNVNYAFSWSGMGGTIKVDTPVSMTKLPVIGQHIQACGPYGPSTTWCDSTIQPLYSWKGL